EDVDQRQLRRQTREHPHDDRPPAMRRLRQLHRRPADAQIYEGWRWGAAVDARAARRRGARICLRTSAGSARLQDRYIYPGAARCGEEPGLDSHQHEERLGPYLSVLAVMDRWWRSRPELRRQV